MTFLIVIHILICIFLVCVILLQPGKSDGGIGFGSSSQSIFGSRGAGNFLTKTTSACAIVFLVTSFFLTRARIREFSGSVIKAESKPAPTAPVTPPDTSKAASEKLGEAVKGAGQAQPPAQPATPGKAPAPAKQPLKTEGSPTKK